MSRTDLLAFPANTGDSEYLEDISLRNLVLELYDREHISIQRYVVFLGLSRDTAQELVHDSFLKLHEHLFAGGDRTNLRAWLYRVAHNLARNAQNRSRASKTDSGVEIAGDLAFGGISAEEALLQEERQEQLRAAFSQLSTSQKECLLLRTQGLKYREIGEILKLSVSTVGENVQRGLARLKELL